MKKFDLTKIVSIECIDKKIYMVCDTTSEIQSCINQGKIVLNSIAYYKPYVNISFVNENIKIPFDIYEEAIEYYNNFESKFGLPNLSVM